MAWRAAFPATVLSLMAFVACRGATGDAPPVVPAPRPSALAVVPPVAPCPTAVPAASPPTAAPPIDPAPAVDPAPSVDPGPWISTVPPDAKRLGSHVLCGTTRCEGDTPWCCADRRWPRCVSVNAACKDSMFQCMSASDCGAGRICCTHGGGGTQCEPTCTNEATPLCQTAADCRGLRMAGPEGTSFPLEHCRSSPDFGVKYCAPAWE